MCAATNLKKRSCSPASFTAMVPRKSMHRLYRVAKYAPSEKRSGFSRRAGSGAHRRITPGSSAGGTGCPTAEKTPSASLPSWNASIAHAGAPAARSHQPAAPHSGGSAPGKHPAPMRLPSALPLESAPPSVDSSRPPSFQSPPGVTNTE